MKASGNADASGSHGRRPRAGLASAGDQTPRWRGRGERPPRNLAGSFRPRSGRGSGCHSSRGGDDVHSAAAVADLERRNARTVGESGAAQQLVVERGREGAGEEQVELERSVVEGFHDATVGVVEGERVQTVRKLGCGEGDGLRVGSFGMC